MSKKDKPQVLLRGDGWRIVRSDDIYGYRAEGEELGYGYSLPLCQEDVATLFKDAGKEWRWEQRNAS